MKLVEALKTVPLNKLVPISRHITFGQFDENSLPSFPMGRRVRSELRFTMEQTVSEEDLRSNRNDVLEFCNERAKAAMLHELYLPIIDELRSIQILAWENETPDNQEISTRIGKLIGEMK